MFGRKKADSSGSRAVIEAELREGAKNRPTPRRREAEAANRRPIVPRDRKAAARKSRDKARAERMAQRRAVDSGDERHLPPQHAGPQRRLVRDIVDSRWNVGELYLPVVLAMLGMLLLPGLIFDSPDEAMQWQGAASLSLYVFVLIVVIDTAFLWRKVKATLRARFGPDVSLRGLLGYTFTRSVSLRGMRRPPAVVARGQAPR